MYVGWVCKERLATYTVEAVQATKFVVKIDCRSEGGRVLTKQGSCEIATRNASAVTMIKIGTMSAGDMGGVEGYFQVVKVAEEHWHFVSLHVLTA